MPRKSKKAKRAAAIKRAQDFSDENDDLPDGAFFALAAERGIPIEDFALLAESQAQEETK